MAKNRALRRLGLGLGLGLRKMAKNLKILAGDQMGNEATKISVTRFFELCQ